jgi:hypothetical protein
MSEPESNTCVWKLDLFPKKRDVAVRLLFEA